MTARYVLTGGHGTGKSSIIHGLEERGEHVVTEAAAALMALGRARGVAFPDDETCFQSTVIDLQRRREARVPATAGRVFLDRGLPDATAYAAAGHWRLSPADLRWIADARYDRVFHVDPPPDGVPTLTDGESAFCDRLCRELDAAYGALGMPPLHVPYAPLDERVAFVLGTLAGGPG
jgi:predicted ATPase